MIRAVWLIALGAIVSPAVAWQTSAPDARLSRQSSPRGTRRAEADAVAFLRREVPRWKAENDCYSCHNNGDAARALLMADARGHDVGDAINDTLEWLRHPSRWNKNKTEGGIDDKPLARIQFAGALQMAVDNRRASRESLIEAARLLISDQKDDGSWQLDSSQSIGSPATYGTTLATASARRVIAAVASKKFAKATANADAWLRKAKVETVLDAAAVLLGLVDAVDSETVAQRGAALETLMRGQSVSGGWGPYVTAAPEVFDTALVLLALTEVAALPSMAAPAFDRQKLAAAIARGRAFLVAEQLSDGSWPETTRPTGQESYAQRISTTGWALAALIESAK